jgi:hypothetical protein
MPSKNMEENTIKADLSQLNNTLKNAMALRG